MDPHENTKIDTETTTIEWALCSSNFEGIVIIVPQNLNNIPNTSQYEEISTKQICKRYFKVECCKNQQMK